MGDTTTLTIRISRSTGEALQRIAKGARRSKSVVAAEVLDSFVKEQVWWESKIAAARESRVLSEEEVAEMWKSLEADAD